MKWPPECDDCHRQLTKPGAVVIGPPDALGLVRKFHLCVLCYGKWFDKLEKP